jgi:oligopeptide transport system substrate-binding protein
MRRVLLIPTIVLLVLATVCFAISAGLSPSNVPATKAASRPVVFANGDEIKTLDVGKMSWASDIRAAMGLWEGLVAYDPKTLRPVPGVAEKWTVSPDGKTYTFTLRPDARWSNGDPVTAHDFLFSWQRVLTPSTGGDYISLFKVIIGAEDFTAAIEKQAKARDSHAPAGPAPLPATLSGIEIPEPRTLIVHLNNPCTYFLDLCAFPPFYPLHEASMAPFLDKTDPLKGYDGEWTHPPHLVTNGPYRLTEWKFKQYLLFTPNPYYWDRANVKCDRLYLKAISEDRSALLALQTGTVDALSFVPQSFGDDLLASQDPEVRKTVHFRPVFGAYYYIFNCTKPPLDDKRVRKALSLAVDRQEIVTKVTRMGQRPIGLLVPPDSIPGYLSPPELPHDVDFARKLLAEAGYPGGKGLRAIEIVYNSDTSGHAKVAQAIAQMWQQKLGVTVTFRALERGSFANNRKERVNGKPTFDVSRGGWYGDYTDPTTWLDLLRSTDGNNDGHYVNPAYDALLDQAAAEPDPTKRFAILRDAERMIVQDELPILPLYQYNDGYMFDADKIKGLDVNVRLLTQFKWIHRAD